MTHAIDLLKTLRRLLRADGAEKAFILISFDHDKANEVDEATARDGAVLIPYSISFAGMGEVIGFSLLRSVAEHAPGADSTGEFVVVEPWEGH